MDMKSTLLEEIKHHVSEWGKDDIYAVSLYVYDNLLLLWDIIRQRMSAMK